ncbi:hypothetical protein CYMTET_5105 [Cymbomonas tetramitiformis]|uniref:Cyanocobalamin reductase (cyanide-eliminating) n=1 Tax=Cymbomonas tetramitiformis TaxID=36881 RepID=A0AAE0GZV6_9CHLO|nr:hypothetical protein CYMTET_5105 [Cymbomonas tetramitiformis]
MRTPLTNVSAVCRDVLDGLDVAYSVYWSCASADEGIVAMQRVAEVSGVAHLCPATHLCLHPVYGAWWSLRAVVVVDIPCDDLCMERPSVMPSPLSALERERAENLLAEALSPPTSKQPENGSADNKVQEHPSLAWIRLRDVVTAGREYRFSDDQIAYHYRKDRRALNRALDEM